MTANGRHPCTLRVWRYLLLLGLALPVVALAELSPMISLTADIGTLFLKEGTLKVAVSGVYIQDQMSVKIDISFSGRERCTGGELNRQCNMTGYEYGYEDIHDILSAIDAASAALKSGSALQRQFKMDAAPDCLPMWGKVTIAARGTVAEFVLAEGSSTYTITTDVDQLAAFRSSLQRATDLRQHIRPQIDAFNHAQPDRSKPMEDEPDLLIRASGVRLTFNGAAASSYSFTLENGSNREISYRGSGESPVDWSMACRAAGKSTPDIPAMTLVDGRFHTVTLTPGKTVRFKMENHDFFDTGTYASRYPGGLCRLHVRLENSEEVESTEFTP